MWARSIPENFPEIKAIAERNAEFSKPKKPNATYQGKEGKGMTTAVFGRLDLGWTLEDAKYVPIRRKEFGRKCSVPGCGEKHRARSLCNSHFRGWVQLQRGHNIRSVSFPDGFLEEFNKTQPPYVHTPGYNGRPTNPRNPMTKEIYLEVNQDSVIDSGSR